MPFSKILNCTYSSGAATATSESWRKTESILYSLALTYEA